MRITTLIYSVVFIAMGVPTGSLFAQSTAAPGPQPESAQIVAPAKVKRNLNPESIKRAKLTRLRKDVVLTDDQATKVKPIIDAMSMRPRRSRVICLSILGPGARRSLNCASAMRTT